MNLEIDRTDLKHAEAPRNLTTKRKETHRFHYSVALVLTLVINFHGFYDEFLLMINFTLHQNGTTEQVCFNK